MSRSEAEADEQQGEVSRGERGLFSPSAEAPAVVDAGGHFAFEVQTASALTPPPGVQEPRAYRNFSVALCALGVPFGSAPEQMCFALAIQNLRPLGSHSLAYRVEVFVPHWVADGFYTLRVRFPGGSAEVMRGVRVGETTQGELLGSCAVEARSVGASLRLSLAGCDVPSTARVHVAFSEGVASDAPFTAYPRAGEDGGLATGAVLRVPLLPGQQLQLTQKPARPEAQRAIAVRPPQAGSLGALTILGPSRSAEQVYWVLSPWESALGPRATLRLVGPRAARVTAVVVHTDGATERVTEDVSALGYRRGLGGCGVGVVPSGPLWPILGLLFMAVSRKLGRRAPGRG